MALGLSASASVPLKTEAKDAVHVVLCMFSDRSPPILYTIKHGFCKHAAKEGRQTGKKPYGHGGKADAGQLTNDIRYA